jgi:hypothetical protein
MLERKMRFFTVRLRNLRGLKMASLLMVRERFGSIRSMWQNHHTETAEAFVNSAEAFAKGNGREGKGRDDSLGDKQRKTLAGADSKSRRLGG